MANPICFKLLVHWLLLAASRAAWTAGRSKAIKIPIIAITTSNSTNVNPARRFMAHPSKSENFPKAPTPRQGQNLYPKKVDSMKSAALLAFKFLTFTNPRSQRENLDNCPSEDSSPTREISPPNVPPSFKISAVNLTPEQLHVNKIEKIFSCPSQNFLLNCVMSSGRSSSG
jgi:hypothetical protein